jgi:pantoate--beta-alanine ligase
VALRVDSVIEMDTLQRIGDLRAAVHARRAQGAVIGLVPTMGALHAGHLALVRALRERCACVVMSIFVNPLQFGPAEDFTAYPRTIEADTAGARDGGVDLLFTPAVDEMYPAGRAVSVTPGGLDARWEGAARPGHFVGVLTAVAKLLHIVQPDVVALGQKDAQQVALVRAMLRDLDIPVQLHVVPTVRDPDGLALSSRNAYLSPEERLRALALPRALRAMEHAWRTQGIADAARLEAIGQGVLRESPAVKLDYLGLAEPEHLEAVRTVVPGSLAMIAARVGRTRLIDNIIFGNDTALP